MNVMKGNFFFPFLSVSSGSDVVEWLFHHIEGFQDRREARKYASNLLKAGFIRHTVNKITFSEQCYYVFGDLSDCENCESPENSTHQRNNLLSCGLHTVKLNRFWRGFFNDE